ncbi:MAG: UDP-N-acetylmuramoyl-L-alanyl-D-glutamate--2,6-diaminopimelate ligase [Eubacteriales bacterium]|nr:UDP-N-acetylmuramoyl-L-alanyl-D-glutamate--2,6-diaminopimelate ligase [Eubacteriales bacterium]
MKLSELVKGLEIVDSKGSMDTEITSIVYDSRKAKPGSLFVCIDGTIADGHKFIQPALENGASALLIEKDAEIPDNVPCVRLKDNRYGLAYISDRFFGHPSEKFSLIGVTGTKGKTTTTYMIKSILEAAEQKVGLIGTVEKLIDNRVIYMDRTTPESYDLQSLFAEMADSGLDTVAMEVSSQGLKLHRVGCVDFDIGIFTNISRAHIGPREHDSFEDYLESKIKLFGMCKKGIINIDSPYADRFLKAAECEVITYGFKNKADIYAENIVKHPDRVEFRLVSPWYTFDLSVGVPGEFSIYNALGAIGAAALLGAGKDDVAAGLKRVNVKGRVETVETNTEYTVIIDYAHSPDSLENILRTVKDFTPGRLICLFGCGGDRDRLMRPMMGEISGRLADFTIITSDNPRTEEPEAIVGEIEEGIKKTDGKYTAIVNRKEAIKYALDMAKRGDVIILAGKGHETYQTFKDKTIHFDEREVVKELLNGGL